MMYDSLKVVMAVVVAVALINSADAASTPFPCTYTSTTGQYYDLSAMYKSTARTEYTFKDARYDEAFFINVCGESHQPCSPPNGNCMQSYATNPVTWYPCGDARNATWADIPSATGVQILYSGGLPCNGIPRSTLLNITCDTSAGVGVLDFVQELSLCRYVAHMRSQHACPTSRPPSNIYLHREKACILSGNDDNNMYFTNLCTCPATFQLILRNDGGTSIVSQKVTVPQWDGGAQVPVSNMVVVPFPTGMDQFAVESLTLSGQSCEDLYRCVRTRLEPSNSTTVVLNTCSFDIRIEVLADIQSQSNMQVIAYHIPQWNGNGTSNNQLPNNAVEVPYNLDSKSSDAAFITAIMRD